MKVRIGIEQVAAMMLMVVLCLSVTVAVKGYGLYQKAIDSVSFEDKMASIRVKESHTIFNRLSEIYVDVMLSMEDHRFYNHPGIGVIVIGRAVFSGIKAGSFMEGVSMVTQQLARNMHFNQEEELIRKAVGVLVAFDLERNYGKNKIPELYVNTIYCRSGHYCAKDASNGYFGKGPEDMTDYESTLLAGILNAPSCYVPTISQELTVRHQRQVLDRLVKCGYFTEKRALETIVVRSSW